ncbi:MAG TPA: DUF5329 family protein [Chthoniobacteraceae bacterium]
MNFALPALSTALLLVLSTRPARAVDPEAQTEIEYLLGYISQSGYRFIRSGKEYAATEGAEHMRQKLQRAGNRVKSADDFIRGIASRSFLTGEQYLVKAPDGRQFEAGEWLTKALDAFRKAKR